MKTKGILLTILSAIIFGIVPIVTKQVYATGANAMSVTFMRYAMVLPMLGLFIKCKNLSLKLDFIQLKNILITAIFGSCMTTLLLNCSYTYIAAGTATTLHFLYPLFVAVLCKFIYKENLGFGKCIGLGMSFLGILLFMDISSGDNFTGILMAITSSITYAFYMVQVEKKHLSYLHPYILSFYTSLFICLALGMSNLFVPSIQLKMSLTTYGNLLLVATAASFLAVSFLQIGIRFLGASSASLFSLFEPITSILLGSIWLKETLGSKEIAGCICIFIAVVLLVYFEGYKHKKR